MRTKKVLKNVIFSFLNMGITTLLAFVSRIIFARVLSQEYLGVSGLFTSILTVLSLAELGIGDAICYSLYEPLANNDTKKVQALMQLYGKIYRTIGCIVFGVGILLLPVYPLLISQTTSIEGLNWIYLLFVTNTSVSYFGVYKKNLIIYDQKEYIANIYNLVFYGLRIVSQSALLLITRSYLLYLIIQVIFTVLENLAISAKANNDYPYLKKRVKTEISIQEITLIRKNTYALLLHKVGDILLNSMDNILLSRFFGLIATGIYSNYQMVFNSLGGIIWRVFSSATASIGNLNASESNEKIYASFRASFFINAYFNGLVVCGTLVCMQPFIQLAFGTEYLLRMETLVALVVSFYINRMRSAINSFRSATGAFYYDRYVTLIQAIINIVASVVFSHFLGVTGIFIGTSLSMLSTTFWVEPLILYKCYFKHSFVEYFSMYVKYTIHIAISAVFSLLATHYISEGPIGLVIRGVLSTMIFSSMYLVAYRRTAEMQYFMNHVNRVVNIFHIKV